MYLILECAEDGLAENLNGHNLISFLGLSEEKMSEHAMAVDRGVEGYKQEYLTLIAPKGKHKSKMNGYTQIAKQHTPLEAGMNRTLTRVRNINEHVRASCVDGCFTLRTLSISLPMPTLHLY